MSDILVVKKELIQTMSTRGWRFITERADVVIKQMTESALDEEEKDKADRLITDARSARKFWKQFLLSLESAKQVETADNNDEWNEVSMD
jgi:hypothetical protein